MCSWSVGDLTKPARFCLQANFFKCYANIEPVNTPVSAVNVTTFAGILDSRAAANLPNCFGNNAAVQIPARLSENLKKRQCEAQRDTEKQRNTANREEAAIVIRHFRLGISRD